MKRGSVRKSALAIALIVAFVATSGVPALTPPAIVLDPTSGPAGSTVTVNGRSFERHCPVDLFLDSTATDPLISGVVVTKSGAFSASIVIPDQASLGDHTLIARGTAVRKNRNCKNPRPTQASATFTVVAPKLQLYDRTIHLAQRALDDARIDEGFLDEISRSNDVVHGIVQLHSLPEMGDLEDVEELGITLLDYLNGDEADGTAYIASISPDVGVDNERFGELVRAVQRLIPEDKMSVTFELSATPSDVLVLFFADVSEADAFTTLRRAGVEESEQVGPHSYEASVDEEQAARLASAEAVQWIQERPEPRPTLDDARLPTGVDLVQQFSSAPTPTYNGLSGKGTQIAVFDSGVDDKHPDFEDDRVIRIDPPRIDAQGNPEYHGTFVASIAAGNGSASDKADANGHPNGGLPYEWRGMAPESQIAAYSSGGMWDYGTMEEAIKRYGIEVSNNSYVLDHFGRYDYASAATDDIIAGAFGSPPADVRPDAYMRPAVTAASNNADRKPRIDCDNDGNKDPLPDYPDVFDVYAKTGQCPAAYQTGYFSVLHACKNCIVATAVAKENGEPYAPNWALPRPNDLVHLAPSGLGPALDGRLKPDIAAVADFIRSAGPNNGYTWGGATSGASPAVAGVVALMYEAHMKAQEAEHTYFPLLPSAVKAILVQSAVDLVGSDPLIEKDYIAGTYSTANFDTGKTVEYGVGPDFATGYGLMDAAAALEMVERRQFELAYVNETDPENNHGIDIAPGQPELRVTVAWDDRPGSVNQPANAKTLVNDLDLTLRGPNGEVHRPLVLETLRPRDCEPTKRGVQVGTCPGKDDPNKNYFGPAKEGIDRRNNLEQVVVKDPAPGTWTAHVSVRNTDRPYLGLPGSPPPSSVRMPLGGDQLYSLATGQIERPDLHITVTGDPATTGPGGDPLTYTMTVTNNGEASALGARVVDTLPEDVNFLGSTGSCNATSIATVTCAIGDLAPGEQRTFDLYADVPASFGYNDYPAVLTNRARASSLVPDADPSDNVAIDTVNVTYAADLEVVSVDLGTENLTKLAIGQQATATVTVAVRNNGPASPVDAVLGLIASASSGASVDPSSVDEVQYGFPAAPEPEVFTRVINISCSQPGTRSFTVTAAFEPSVPVSDGHASNDQRTAEHQFKCTHAGPTEL
jgi:uncharacterized repeat protein (TIGR01451 family)